MVGSIQYLAVQARPDICRAASTLDCNVAAPAKKQLVDVERVLRYLSGTRDMGLLMKIIINQNS